LEYFAFKEPYFDTDFSIHGLGFDPSIVNIGTEGVQRGATFFMFFCTRYFCACQTTADTDFDAFGSCTHRPLNGTFDGATVVDTGFDLLGHLFANDIGIKFGLTDFEDVDLYIFAREQFEFFFDEVNLLAAFADNNTGTAGVDSDGNALHGALDSDTADTVLHRLITVARVGGRRFRAPSAEVVADFFVLYYFKTVVFVGIPVGVPSPDDA
jgi:hypothetical protein